MVAKAIKLDTNAVVAIKKLRRVGASKTGMELPTLREIMLLQVQRHPPPHVCCLTRGSSRGPPPPQPPPPLSLALPLRRLPLRIPTRLLLVLLQELQHENVIALHEVCAVYVRSQLDLVRVWTRVRARATCTGVRVRVVALREVCRARLTLTPTFPHHGAGRGSISSPRPRPTSNLAPNPTPGLRAQRQPQPGVRILRDRPGEADQRQEDRPRRRPHQDLHARHPRGHEVLPRQLGAPSRHEP